MLAKTAKPILQKIFSTFLRVGRFLSHPMCYLPLMKVRKTVMQPRSEDLETANTFVASSSSPTLCRPSLSPPFVGPLCRIPSPTTQFQLPVKLRQAQTSSVKLTFSRHNPFACSRKRSPPLTEICRFLYFLL